MSTRINRQILLNAHPVGFPLDTDFKMVETPVPEPGDGELLIRTIYQSLDPYMRGRMNPGLSYTTGVSLGEVMGAGTVGQVVASRHDRFAEGDLVLSSNGWQEYAVSNGEGGADAGPGGGADLDGRRGARHAGYDRVCRAARRWRTEGR